VFLIDTASESASALCGSRAAQIARYSPDNSLVGITSLKSDTVSLIDLSFREQTAIKVGSQPMDMAFRGDELFVACQGDGSVHVIDIPYCRAKMSFPGRYGMRVARVFLIVPPETTAETPPLPGRFPEPFHRCPSGCMVTDNCVEPKGGRC
jgi:YVTN family beta-propeller protein